MLRRWWLPSAFAEENKATWGGSAAVGTRSSLALPGLGVTAGSGGVMLIPSAKGCLPHKDGCRMSLGVGATPGKRHRDGNVACVCRERIMRCVPGDVSHDSSAFPLLCALCSAQAVPGTLSMKNHQPLPFPAHDTSNFSSLCLEPSIFLSYSLP